MPIRGDKLSQNVEITAHVSSRQTEYQRIDIYDTTVFGRTLLLDGHIQLTEFDEKAYHECLVQIPLLNIARPRRALVIGGGDGGVLRELCRQQSLEEIVMVEIDSGVIEECRKHMPTLSAGAFDDPRVNLIIGDAFAEVPKLSGAFDLIISDSTDVYEGEDGNLSEMLFTSKFYEVLAGLLSDDGFLVTQADNLVFCPYSLEVILSEFGKVFPRTGQYLGLVPSFGGYSGFAWASKTGEMAEAMPRRGVFTYLNQETYALAFADVRFA
jgi:spermidine synthase